MSDDSICSMYINQMSSNYAFTSFYTTKLPSKVSIAPLFSSSMAPATGKEVFRPPASFIVKTYLLVDNRSTDNIISWNASGSTFIIWHPGKFGRNLLPEQFKHKNFTRFVRHLNSYGFKRNSMDRREYSHEFLRSGQEHLLCRIRRQKSSQGTAAAAQNKLKSGDDPWPSESNCPITYLMKENELLKRENIRLISDNTQMKSLCVRIRLLVANYEAGVARGSSPAMSVNGRVGMLELEAHRALDAREVPSGSEVSEFYPVEEEDLSLRLSL